MDEASRALREQIAALKEIIAEKEANIGKHNPDLFHTLQVSSWLEICILYYVHRPNNRPNNLLLSCLHLRPF